jgi:hypothetical protein
MDKKSGGQGQGGGGGQPRPTSRPNLSSDPADPGPNMNPRATLEAIAAVVAQPVGSPPASKGKDAVDPKKALDTSTFNSGKKTTQRLAQLPGVWHGTASNPEEGAPSGEEGAAPVSYDGTEPAPEVTDRDLWKAIVPPVQSREEKRSAEVYQQVINQFSVSKNPRYEPDGPGKPRAHIFVWDVSRAMNSEIPHMLGARELTLNQTIDWLRFESGQRGWVKLTLQRALEAANEGRLVVVVPRDIRAKPQLMGIVQPGGARPDGHPRIAAAGKAVGTDLSPAEALGLHAVEYFSHA